MKPAANNVYGVHCQQKLATPHTRRRQTAKKPLKHYFDIIYNFCTFKTKQKSTLC